MNEVACFFGDADPRKVYFTINHIVISPHSSENITKIMS